MSASSITTAIQTSLEAIRDGNKVVFKDILDYATNKFNGFPTITIYSTDMGSEFASSAENLRMYKFDIVIYLKDATPASWRRARVLQELVANQLDKSGDLGRNDWILMPAVVSEVVAETIGNGEHIKATISVIVKSIIMV